MLVVAGYIRGDEMTFEEALELFGLSRIPSEAVLKVLRNDAVKEAMEAKDEERQKDKRDSTRLP